MRKASLGSAIFSRYLLRRWLGVFIMGSVTGLFAGCKHEPTTAPVAEASTPKMSAIVFEKALQAGDIDTLLQVSVGTNSEFEVMRKLCAQTKKLANHANAENIAGRMEHYAVTIEGDTATIGTDSGPMKRVKDAETWKVDLKSIVAMAKSSTTRAKRDMSSLEIAIEMYHLNVGAFPPNLDALVNNPGATGWQGPYLKIAVPNDPWGRPYRYVVPGVRNPNAFDLSSAGPNGLSGDEDDITG